MTRTILQGNICQCGGIWFSQDFGYEGQPSFCPFCGGKVSEGERFTKNEMNQKEKMVSLPPEIKENIEKANDKKMHNLVIKICEFCTNEVFFDENDAHNANTCPYCAGKLLNMEPDPLLEDFKNAFSNITNMYELLGKTIFIKLKSFNPFKKPKKYKFLGIDQLSLFIKIQNIENKNITWIPLNDIKRIWVDINHETNKEL